MGGKKGLYSPRKPRGVAVSGQRLLRGPCHALSSVWSAAGQNPWRVQRGPSPPPQGALQPRSLGQAPGGPRGQVSLSRGLQGGDWGPAKASRWLTHQPQPGAGEPLPPAPPNWDSRTSRHAPRSIPTPAMRDTCHTWKWHSALPGGCAGGCWHPRAPASREGRPPLPLSQHSWRCRQTARRAG